MKLTFIGATHEVTGSCFYLEAAGKKVLIDCGMEQGKNYYENAELPVNPGDLDFALLTHAHIDHSGNLPALYAKGFHGNIYATEATCHLCDIMLRDSAHIQMFEAEWRNRKGRRSGKPEFIPAYTIQDALGAIKLFVSCDYGKKIHLAEGIVVRFTDAGHLLGSSSIEVWVTEDGQTEKIVFSGDIGNTAQPLIRDPSYIKEADYVVMESTYGDRSHGERPDYVNSLAQVIQRTFDRGGNLVIPSFAVGRTQEMLYFIRQIKEDGLVHGHDGFTVYVDSPLANEATTIFQEHRWDCYDEEALALIERGVNPLGFQGLKTSITSDDSKAINFDESCKVIISASGMCDAGRIKHHLKHNLWDERNTILFVGYQAIGTLGRALVEGADTVKLFGEEIHVAAEICQLPGISGHADVDGLLKWAGSLERKPKKVFVVHGDDLVTETFAQRLKDVFGYDAYAPFSGTVYDLAANAFIYQAEGVRIREAEGHKLSAKTAAVFDRLLAMGRRLMEVIRKNEGVANKDLEKFTREVQSLCDKWDR
ncbi:MAG: MBL fold metallo-hydrolase RNA specificity domain-containing protein [Blautia sp.]|jgi:metallo-beta-lactamase family protein